MALRLVTPPDADPVSLEEFKAHARIGTSADLDGPAALAISAATGIIQDDAGIQLMAAGFALVVPRFPSGRGRLYLPRPPLASVEEIAYLDADGVSHVFGPPIPEGEEEGSPGDETWAIEPGEEPGYIFLLPGIVWPTMTVLREDAVTISYTAGYADAAAVPAAAKIAISLLAASILDNPESEVLEVGARFTESETYRRFLDILRRGAIG